MSTSIKDKIVLITGASRGIGAATAREFAKEGALVMLAARTAHEISSIADEINAAGGKAIAEVVDVANYQDLERATQRCKNDLGGLDILVNNAGVIDPISRMSSSDPEQWAKTADINYKGVYFGMRAALPHFLEQGHGTIITVSSGAAHGPMEGWSHYCGAKAGAHMLTRCVHKENSDQGVRVFGLSPGTVATDMQVKIKASGINPVSQLDPNVHIDPSWPARAIVWLCTDAADAYLGEEIALKDEKIRKLIGLD